MVFSKSAALACPATVSFTYFSLYLPELDDVAVLQEVLFDRWR